MFLNIIFGPLVQSISFHFIINFFEWLPFVCLCVRNTAHTAHTKVPFVNHKLVDESIWKYRSLNCPSGTIRKRRNAVGSSRRGRGRRTCSEIFPDLCLWNVKNALFRLVWEVREMSKPKYLAVTSQVGMQINSTKREWAVGRCDIDRQAIAGTAKYCSIARGRRETERGNGHLINVYRFDTI